MGTSMGGMHTWMGRNLHPDFMDARHAHGQSLPFTQISGSQPRAVASHSDSDGQIRHDPAWHDGDYTTQPAESAHCHERCFGS